MTQTDRPTRLALARTALRGTVIFARKAALQAAILSLPLAAVLAWLSVMAAQIAETEIKPFGTFLMALVLAVLVAIPAQAALLRHALRSGAGPVFGLRLAQDAFRLAIAALLIAILGFTVFGAAGLGLVSILAALDLAARSTASAPEIDSDSPETVLPVLGEYFGTAEWVVAGLVIALFAGFVFWFSARLSLAYAATVARQKVQVLSSFALTRGRWLVTGLVMAAALLPGVLTTQGLMALTDLPGSGGAAGLAGLVVVHWPGALLVLLLGCGAGASLYQALGGDETDPIPS